MVAQVAAIMAPDLLPAIVGDAYTPPGHSVAAKNCFKRNSRLEYKINEDPLGEKPYLWVSAEILVTPFILKSKVGILKPAFSANGARNPPRQQSTCINIPWYSATLANSSIGSITP